MVNTLGVYIAGQGSRQLLCSAPSASADRRTLAKRDADHDEDSQYYDRDGAVAKGPALLELKAPEPGPARAGPGL